MKRKQAAYSEVITEALGTKQDSTTNTFAFSLRLTTPCPPEKGLCRGGPCDAGVLKNKTTGLMATGYTGLRFFNPDLSSE